MQRKDSIMIYASIIHNCISAKNRHCCHKRFGKEGTYWQEREANVMKGLIHGLMHSVRQLCGDAMNVLKASPKQYELPAISEERQLQTVATLHVLDPAESRQQYGAHLAKRCCQATARLATW